MLVKVVLILQFIFVQTYKYQKPVAEKIWSVRCKTNEYVLNDCNWCSCGQDHHFKCKARVCEEVDMFGHFKDTIQELDVGMEGHGSWRSRPYSCNPGIKYQRGTILCVCDEDGNWPNPVCRDLFRILHTIEVTENVEEATSQTCSPTKLYLVGCNACFCPSSGKLDANFCTNRTCSDGDPVLEPKEPDQESTNPQVETKADAKLAVTVLESSDYSYTEPTDIIDANLENVSPVEKAIRKEKEVLEIYAPCNPQKTYTIGRQQCKCLANNRLICKDFDKITKQKLGIEQVTEIKDSRCKGKIGRIIKKSCNLCKCMSATYMYCTTKKCLPSNKGLSFIFRELPRFGKLVAAPIDDVECVPGTSYKRGCNTCYCKMERGKKIFGCKIRPCVKPTLQDMARDCVSGTKYETDCYICNCDVIDGEKHQACKISPKCSRSMVLKETHSKGLDALHGYCEPLHVYKEDCNTCRCLSNGKLVKCTTRVCTARSTDSLEVEIVPFQQAENELCPEGHSYKVGCNLCFCLSNGNSLCTTADCSKQKFIN